MAAKQISENSPESVPREQQVATAAYYRADKRGFTPGNEIADWLEAEREFPISPKEEGTSGI